MQKMTDPQLDTLLMAPEFPINPHPALHILREQKPVHWCEPMKVWLVTSYDDCVAVLRDNDNFSNVGRPGFDDEPGEVCPELRPANLKASDVHCPQPRNVLNTDPPEHTRLRNATISLFTPKAVEEWHDRLFAFADEHLATIEKPSMIDAVSKIAVPIANYSLHKILGLKAADAERLPPVYNTDNCIVIDNLGTPSDSEWGQRYNAYISSVATPQQIELPSHITALMTEGMTVDGAFEEKGILHRVQCAQKEGVLSREEAVAYGALLVGAGIETTKLFMMTTLGQLLIYDQMEALRANPSLIPSAAEEAIRLETTATRIPRRTRQDCELRGQHIRKGDIVYAVLLAANRDPARYEDPDTFKLDRFTSKQAPQLAYSIGRHACLGKDVARLECRVMLEALLKRFDHISLAMTPLPWEPRYQFRALGPQFPINVA